MWKVEGCFAAAIDPWRPAGEVSDEEVAGDRPRDAPADAARPPPTASRTASRSSTAAPGSRARAAGRRRRSRSAASGTTTARRYWCPACQALRRIGHKGADHIAPGNTPESFDAALAHGVHMIEFDVLPEDLDDREHGELRLAHDYSHDLSVAPTLEQGLAHLAGDAFGGDRARRRPQAPRLRGAGRRRAARARAGRAHARLHAVHAQPGEAARARARAAARLVGAARQARLHRARCCTPCPPTRSCSTRAAGCRASPPATSRAGRCDAVMCHFKLVTPRAAARPSARAGGELYVWTVDDARRIRLARGARRHGRDHQRPAAVRLHGAQAIEQLAAE